MREKEPVVSEAGRIAELVATPVQDRLKWLDANLTSQSRQLFQECVTENTPQAGLRLKKVKECYWALAEETKDLIFAGVQEDCIFPEFYVHGFFSVLKQSLGPELYQEFLRFPLNPNDFDDQMAILPLLGILAMYNHPDYFLEKNVPVLKAVKEKFQQGKFSVFFGNVSNGNFDASLLAAYCQADFDQFRLYQYSHKAMHQYKATGFRTLDSELEGIAPNEGICIIDGFCITGESIEESIRGFRKRGFFGPIYVFISHGSFPALRGMRIKQLSPPEPLLPGELSASPMFLEVVSF